MYQKMGPNGTSWDGPCNWTNIGLFLIWTVCHALVSYCADGSPASHLHRNSILYFCLVYSRNCNLYLTLVFFLEFTSLGAPKNRLGIFHTQIFHVFAQYYRGAYSGVQQYFKRMKLGLANSRIIFFVIFVWSITLTI